MSDELKQVLDIINEVKTNHIAFMKANDEKLAMIEKKGHADPLLIEQIAKLNKAIDEAEVKRGALEKELKGRSDALEAALKRGDHRSAEETKTQLEDGTEVEVKANQRARASFQQFLRKGHGSLVTEGRQGWTPDVDEVKTMAVRSDPDGGFLVTSDMNGRVIRRIFETSPLRQIANVITISTDAIEGLTDLDDLNCGWVAEQEARTATGTPKFGKYKIPVHELYAFPHVTQQMLDDASLDVEAYLAAKVADKLGRVENTAFLTGNGTGKPRGILSYASGTTWSNTTKQIEQVESASSGAFDFDSLIDIQYRLKEQYRNRASWILGRLTFPEIRKLKDSQGRYLWEPSTQVGTPSELLGASVYEMNDLPAKAAGAIVMGFGDWNEGYQIVDRQGIRVLRDPFTNKPLVGFYTTKRTGGDVVNGDAIKLYKLKA